MKKNIYESMAIIDPMLEDDQAEEIIKKISETIEQNGGAIREIDRWGRRRLTYPIKKNKMGNYVVLQFEAPTASVSILERWYRLNESILRFLTIALPPNALEHFEELKVKKIEIVEEVLVEPEIEIPDLPVDPIEE